MLFQSNLLLVYLVGQLQLAISGLCIRTAYSGGLYIGRNYSRGLRIDQLARVILSLVHFDPYYFLVFNGLVG